MKITITFQFLKVLGFIPYPQFVQLKVKYSTKCRETNMGKNTEMLTWMCNLNDIKAISYKGQSYVTHIQDFRIRPGDTIAVPEKCNRLIKILTATIYRWVQCIVRVIRDLNILHMKIWSQVLVLLTLRTVRTDLITWILTQLVAIGSSTYYLSAE